jgi:ankyrin repeat protein
VLDGAMREPWLPSFLIGRGAAPEIHHAVQLGMADDVKRMLAGEPALIHARGGDGQMPLHYARTVDMAEYLISRGADINARDVDHESTAAQYMVRDRQDVARCLARRGSRTDVLMASALGDVALVNRLLDADPAAIRTRVTPEWFPMEDVRAGGTIYIWTLGGEKGAHEIAREFGHQDALQALLARTPPSLQRAVVCEMDDAALAGDGRIAAVAIDPRDHARLVAAASRNRTDAALRLLDAGWPAAAAERGVTALHWAAFHGNAALVGALLDRGARRDIRDPEHRGTPRDWAEHGARNCMEASRQADYDAVMRALAAPGTAQ